MKTKNLLGMKRGEQWTLVDASGQRANLQATVDKASPTEILLRCAGSPVTYINLTDRSDVEKRRGRVLLFH